MRRGFGFERERAGAFAEQAAAACGVERPQRVACEQPACVVVEHDLRLDRRVVPDRDRAVRFAVAQRFGRFDDRKRAADAVVGDAGVGALQPVA